ncbi:MAG: hypothetical protein KAQ64_03985 [Candidatus Pacebacteria bacterium]|nr:hypothetical protein [Candidatus Paceibacterota bacterium]
MNKKKLAEYIMAILTINTHRAEDRNTLSSFLADSAITLAKADLHIPLGDAINFHERLWGQAWLKDENSHEILYKKWTDFKNTIEN